MEEDDVRCDKPFDVPFGFHSAYGSRTTGLLYFRNRWYSPESGEWLSQDPLGNVDSDNLYAFNGFDPVNFVDPWGLTKSTEGVADVADPKPLETGSAALVDIHKPNPTFDFVAYEDDLAQRETLGMLRRMDLNGGASLWLAMSAGAELATPTVASSPAVLLPSAAGAGGASSGLLGGAARFLAVVPQVGIPVVGAMLCLVTNCLGTPGQNLRDPVDAKADRFADVWARDRERSRAEGARGTAEMSSAKDAPKPAAPDKPAQAASPGQPEDPGGDPKDQPDKGEKKELSKEAQRGIRSLEKRIAEHEKKLADFKANPTVRAGMEGQPKEVIEAQQQARIRHLEKEIQTFRENIQKILGGE